MRGLLPRWTGSLLLFSGVLRVVIGYTVPGYVTDYGRLLSEGVLIQLLSSTLGTADDSIFDPSSHHLAPFG